MSSEPDALHELRQSWAAGTLGDREFLRLAAAEWSCSEDPCALLHVAALGGRSESIARAVLLTALTLVSSLRDEFQTFRLREQDAILRACRAVEGKEQPFFLPLAPVERASAVPAFVERASRAALRCGLLVYRSPADLNRALELGIEALLCCVSAPDDPENHGLPGSAVAGIVRALLAVPTAISPRIRRKVLGSSTVVRRPTLEKVGRRAVIYAELPDDLPFPDRVGPYSG